MGGLEARLLDAIVQLVMKTLLALIATTGMAVADAPKIQVDAMLGMDDVPLPSKGLLDTGADEALAACVKTAPTSAPVFWLDISSKGVVTTARAHGTGAPKTDACIAAALKKVGVMIEKLPGAIAVVGHIDIPGVEADAQARISNTSVMVAAHTAAWQLTINQFAYTRNREKDVATSLDAISKAFATCSPKRGAKAEPAQALAWVANKKAVFQSGATGYDACMAKALNTIKLPAPESALWLQIAILKAAEPLTPRSTKAGLSKSDAIRDALTTAVRSRKSDLLACTDASPSAKLTKVTVSLRANKANITKAGTGDATADACVRKAFQNVAVSSLDAADKADLEISLEAE